MGKLCYILKRALARKCDEFYTRYEDVERELRHYSTALAGKSVYLPCDDYKESAFWRYFADHFSDLHLRELVATCYSGINDLDQYDLLHDCDIDHTPQRREAVRATLTSDGLTVEPLRGNGYFRSPECVELLDRADVIITNPPFSLFRAFYRLLIQHDKKFLVIGSLGAVSYKDVFPSLRRREAWIGHNKKSMTFRLPADYEGSMAQNQSIRWYTNLGEAPTPPPLALTAHYDPEKYRKFRHYDAICVDRIKDIPCDYDGVMGVPITFVERWCPAQFEIVALDGARCAGLLSNKVESELEGKEEAAYARILIRRVGMANSPLP